jgi:pimeloyl-ACP methyl ester carboxylesterase
MRDLRIKTGDIHLQVREYQGEGDAVIFLHFGGGNLMMWQRAIPYFQDQYRLILVDLRDHGKSDKPQTNAHIDDMARDVAGVMEHLKFGRAHIIGSSLGAEVGLSLAANYPKKVISLVCEGALFSEFGPYGIWDGTEAEFREYVNENLAGRNRPDVVFNSVEALVESRKLTFEQHGWWNDYFSALYEYDACKIGEGEFTRAWQNTAARKYLEHYFDCRFEDYYKRVECPVLMLSDEEDFYNKKTRAVMEGLAQLTRNAKVVSVSGWIHPYGWLVDPDTICKVVLEFLLKASV